MKRYIRSATGADFKGWKPEHIELWKSIDWRSIGYKEYPVDGTTFDGDVIIYDVGDDGEIAECTFQLFLRPNPVFPPYYRPTDADIKAIGREYSDFGVVGPMFDGNVYGGYQIHDRFETQEVYDVLSR